jgi:hypothetical protein
VKRILTLDGGGIRGVFTLKVLRRIEEIFRTERGDPGLVLRDVFDLFAGTSTGAIIATFLAWGKSVEEIEQLYVKSAQTMFAPAPWYRRHKAKFLPTEISNFFEQQFRDADGTPSRLGTRKFYASPEATVPKYLLVVMRDATTGSSWPVNNNPLDEHNRRTDLQMECNLDIPLASLLRASTAAPTFFPPETIVLNRGPHIFLDGGITPYNNPSLIAALMATLPRHNLNWETGPDKIQLISVGTGHSRICLDKKDAERVHLLDQVKYVVPALMHTVAKEQDKICRVLGHSVNARENDDENEDPNGKTRLLTPAEKKFTYARYNHEFSGEESEEAKRIIMQNFTCRDRLLNAVFEDKSNQALIMDKVSLIDFFQRTGAAYARKSVKPEHLSPGIR